jgi:hypothetical protein
MRRSVVAESLRLRAMKAFSMRAHFLVAEFVKIPFAALSEFS